MMCPYCGEMISDRASVCRHCGRMLSGGQRAAASTGDDSWYGVSQDACTGPEIEQKRKKNRGILVGVITLFVILGLLAVAAIGFGVYTLVRESGAFTQEFDDYDYDYDYEFGVSDLDPSEYAEFEDLLDAYFEAFSDGDAEDIYARFLPALQDAYDGDMEALLIDQDTWYDSYGVPIDEWYVYSVEDYADEDSAEAAEDLGVTFQRVVDVTTEFTVEDDSDSYAFDFDLVQVDGVWYLYAIW